MVAYEKTNPRVKLGAIGETRWTSKNEALKKLFGFFEMWKNAVVYNAMEISVSYTKAVFLSVTNALKIISADKFFATNVIHEAVSLLHQLLKYETILTAITFPAIFEISTPVSMYLHTILI